jgi:pyruvate formate lyase activating enzyme
MIFGGIQKTSLIDYPQKVSCILFLSGCNFRCPYCHNPQLVAGTTTPPDFLTEKWFLQFLEKRKGFLDGVVVSGGEPTLQNRLPSLCKKIKALGYPIKIDTNGSRPEILQRLIDDKLADYIAMDIKTVPESYYPYIAKENRPESILSSIRIILESKIDHEFRTTCVRPFITEEIIRKITVLIEGADRFILQQFQDTGILNPAFFDDTGAPYTGSELRQLQTLSQPYAGICTVRGIND